MSDIEGVLAKLSEQLDWRGPGGKSLGHIVLPREQALVLVQWMEMQLELERMEQPL